MKLLHAIVTVFYCHDVKSLHTWINTSYYTTVSWLFWGCLLYFMFKLNTTLKQSPSETTTARRRRLNRLVLMRTKSFTHKILTGNFAGSSWEKYNKVTAHEQSIELPTSLIIIWRGCQEANTSPSSEFNTITVICMRQHRTGYQAMS